jgi:hypothetical protein
MECQLLNLWLELGAAVAVIVVALPIAAIILVSLASLREESAHSLSGEAPGRGERAARRLLGFRTAHIGAMAPGHTPASTRADDTEVRFVHARRPVSDPGQFSAVRQSQPYRIGAHQRERAGV